MIGTVLFHKLTDILVASADRIVDSVLAIDVNVVDRKPLTHEELNDFHFAVSSSIIKWRLLKSILLLDIYAQFDQIFHHSDDFVAIFGVIVDASC